MIKNVCFTCRINTLVEQKSRQAELFALFLLLTAILGLLVGCRVTTPIDPTGEYIFRDASSAYSRSCPTPYDGNCSTCQTCPAPQRTQTTWLGSSRDPNSTIPKNSTPLISESRDISELILGPTDPVARVGTYVVMVAGVKDKSGKYRKNKQVEWTIDCSSPGGFIDVDRRDWCDIFAGEWDPPRIENPRHAFTSTSRKPLRLTKGTPTPLDDVIVHEGQTWTAISSPCEGTTKLTAVALDSSDWQNRLRAANIHWIDAWPVLPPAKIAQNYSQTLSLQSSVFRANGAPATGCIAVYEIISGAEDVDFKTAAENSGSENVSQIVIPVGYNGAAEAQLVKKSPSAGQTKIRTTIIRDNSDGKFTVPIRLAQGETTIDWGEAGLLISRSGPAMISGGMETSYRITVKNVNSEQLNEIVVTDSVPESFEYQRSIPVGRVLDALATNPDGTRTQKIQWTIPSLEPGQSQTFDVVYRAQTEGNFNLVSTAQAGTVQAEDVMHVRVISSGGYPAPQAPAPTSAPNPITNQPPVTNVDLDIQLVCQDNVNIGNEVVLNAFIKNNGSETVSNLLSSVTFSSGLCSPFGACPVHLKPIASVEPGKTHEFSLKFNAIEPGRQMINYELIAQNGQRFNRQVFISVNGDACQTQNGANEYPTTPDSASEPDENSILVPDIPTQNDAFSNVNIKDQIKLNVIAPAEARSGDEIQITIDVENHSDKNISNIRLACFLDNSFSLIRNSENCVAMDPYKPYWDIIDQFPAKSKKRFNIVVKGNTTLPTISRFVIQQDNIDLVNNSCQINITNANSGDSVPEPVSPDAGTLPDSFNPVPEESMPEPDVNLPSDSNLPSLEDSSLDAPPVDELDTGSLDVPAPDLNLDVPEPASNSGDKIGVNIVTKRSSILTNQTFTCQVSLKNNTAVPMNNVELSFYFPIDSFKLVKLGTTGDTQYDYNALGGFITFKPAATLEPNQSLNYNIRLLPQKNGMTELSAVITAKESGIEDVRQDAKITVKVE